MRASSNIVAGRFFGAEIEPGTFHGAEIEPGTFHLNGIRGPSDDGRPSQASPAQATPPEIGDPVRLTRD
jgi:hypothetical protein